MRRIITSIMFFLLAIFLVGCYNDSGTQKLADDLKITYASGDSEHSVTQDITLPTTVEGATITWASNNAAIKVEGNKGVVTRGDADTNVTLTVTVTKDGKEAKATFNVVVKAKEPVVVDESVTVLFTVTLPAYTPMEDSVYIVGDFTEASGIPSWTPDASEGKMTRVNATTATFELKFEKVTESITISYKYTRGSWDKVEKDASKDELENRTLTITSAQRTVNQADTVATWSDLDAPLTEQEKLDAAKAALTITQANVTEDFELPVTGEYNTQITWASNNTAIKIDGAEAIVTRGTSDVTVILTATIKLDELTTTKVFAIVVLKKDTQVEPNPEIPEGASKVNLLEVIQVLSTFKFRPEAYQTADLSVGGSYRMHSEYLTFIDNDLREKETMESEIKLDNLSFQMSLLNNQVIEKLLLDGKVNALQSLELYKNGQALDQVEETRGLEINGAMFVNNDSIYINTFSNTRINGVDTSETLKGKYDNLLTYNDTMEFYEYIGNIINNPSESGPTISAIINTLEQLEKLEVYKLDDRYYISYNVNMDNGKDELSKFLFDLLVFNFFGFDSNNFNELFDEIINEANVYIFAVIKDKNIERIKLNIRTDFEFVTESSYEELRQYDNRYHEISTIKHSKDISSAQIDLAFDLKFNTLTTVELPTDLDTYPALEDFQVVNLNDINIDKYMISSEYFNDNNTSNYFFSDSVLPGINILDYYNAINNDELIEIIDIYYDPYKLMKVQPTDVIKTRELLLFIDYRLIEERIEVTFIYDNGDILEVFDAVLGEVFDDEHFMRYEMDEKSQIVVYKDEFKNEIQETRGIFEAGTYYVFLENKKPLTITIEEDYQLDIEPIAIYEPTTFSLLNITNSYRELLNQKIGEFAYRIEVEIDGRVYNEYDWIYLYKDTVIKLNVIEIDAYDVTFTYYFNDEPIYTIEKNILEGDYIYHHIYDDFINLELENEIYYYLFDIIINGNVIIGNYSVYDNTPVQINVIKRNFKEVHFNLEDINNTIISYEATTYDMNLYYYIRGELGQYDYQNHMFALYKDKDYTLKINMGDDLSTIDTIYVKVYTDEDVRIKFNIITDLNIDISIEDVIIAPQTIDADDVRAFLSQKINGPYLIDLKINNVTVYDDIMIDGDLEIDVYIYDETHTIDLDIEFGFYNDVASNVILTVPHGSSIQEVVYDYINNVLGYNVEKEVNYIDIELPGNETQKDIAYSNLNVKVRISLYQMLDVIFVVDNEEIPIRVARRGYSYYYEILDYVKYELFDEPKPFILYIDQNFTVKLTEEIFNYDSSFLEIFLPFKIYVKTFDSPFTYINFVFESPDFELELDGLVLESTIGSNISLYEGRMYIYDWLDQNEIDIDDVLIRTYVNDKPINNSYDFYNEGPTTVKYVVTLRQKVDVDYKVYIDTDLIKSDTIEIPYESSIDRAISKVLEAMRDYDIDINLYSFDAYHTRFIQDYVTSDTKLHIYLKKLPVEKINVVINGENYEFEVVDGRVYELRRLIQDFINKTFDGSYSFEFYKDSDYIEQLDMDMLNELPETIYVRAYEAKHVSVEVYYEFENIKDSFETSRWAGSFDYLRNFLYDVAYTINLDNIENYAAILTINGQVYQDYETYRFYKDTVIYMEIVEAKDVTIHVNVTIDGKTEAFDYTGKREVTIWDITEHLYVLFNLDMTFYDEQYDQERFDNVFYEDTSVEIVYVKRDTNLVQVHFNNDIESIIVEYTEMYTYYIREKVFMHLSEKYKDTNFVFELYSDSEFKNSISYNQIYYLQLNEIYIKIIDSSQKIKLQFVFDEGFELEPITVELNALTYIMPWMVYDIVSEEFAKLQKEVDYTYRFFVEEFGEYLSSFELREDCTIFVEIYEPEYFDVFLSVDFNNESISFDFKVKEQTIIDQSFIFNILDDVDFVPRYYYAYYEISNSWNLEGERLMGDIYINVWVENRTGEYNIHSENGDIVYYYDLSEYYNVTIHQLRQELELEYSELDFSEAVFSHDPEFTYIIDEYSYFDIYSELYVKFY